MLRMLRSFILLALLAARLAAQTYTVTTYAGSSPGTEDGLGPAARFRFPVAIAADAAGNLYVISDYNTVRKVSSSGDVTTLAGFAGTCGGNDGIGGAARLCSAHGIATDSSGNVYVADWGTLRKITQSRSVTTLAGTFTSTGSNDGTGPAARFGYPYGVAVDSSNNVFMADFQNHTIRKITPAGVVTTFAGSTGNPGSTDATGTSASFNRPIGLAIDSSNNLYVGDQGNHTIRKISPGGVVTTLAGSPGTPGNVDGAGSAARFNWPEGVAVDGSGNVFVADSVNSTIRKITGGVVTTYAGSFRGTADGTGAGAQFDIPSAVATSGTNVYVADYNNHTIRKIAAGGVVTTLAGTEARFWFNDGTRQTARFSIPCGIATDFSDNTYVADTSTNNIRKIAADGAVTTFAGCPFCQGSTDANGTNASFFNPCGATPDATGNVYVADTGNHTIRKITPSGDVTTLAGLAGLSGSVDATGTTARFNRPIGITTDGTSLYVADTDNHTIRKVTMGGVVTTLAGSPGVTGSANGTGTAATFNAPKGVTFDGAGTLYVTDQVNHAIRKIVLSTAAVSTFAGGGYGTADGIGTAAQFGYPLGVASDSSGNLFVRDTNRVRKITPAAVVTTVAGSDAYGSADGTGSSAQFKFNNASYTLGLSVDSHGSVYVADGENQVIRRAVSGLSDAATIDSSTGIVGTARQLNTSPQTATSWQWTIVRRPANSSAQLSATNIRNPQFTPDADDVYIFRLTATNGSQTSITTVRLDANTLPVITAAAAVNLRAGDDPSGSMSAIATVSDAEDAAGTLTVTVSSAPAGITVSNIVNSSGTVTAVVYAECGAATGVNAVTLAVLDSGGAMSTAALTVNVTGNTPPVLGTYGDQTVNQGQSATVTPSAAPSDNGKWSLSAVASAGFAGGVSAAPGTGQVFIVNPNAGNYTITVTAMDNCNVTTSKSFALTVTAPVIPDRVQNGGFEQNGGVNSPALTDWTVGTSGSGSWYAQSGTASTPPGTGFTVAAPPGGSFAAMTSQSGPGMYILYQDVAIPAQTAPPTLSFRLYLNNQASAWYSPATLDFTQTTQNQQFRMDVIDPAAAVDAVGTGVLLNVYATHPGDPLISASYSTVTASLPTNLTGRTIRLRFAAADNQRYLFAGVDDVQINLRPVITGVPPLSRTAGITDNSSVTIAFVSDREDAAGSLNVTPASAPAGISVGNIANSAGTVTAAVNASCNATVGMNAVTLQVVDSGGNTATANLSVSVVASMPPTLGNYGDVSTGTPGTLSVTPTAAPSGSGTVNLTVAASPAFISGSSLSVSSSTGVVSIGSAKSGTYTITVTATGNCSSTAAKSFTLTVIPPFGAPANLVATATIPTASCPPASPVQVKVTWSAVANATSYHIERTPPLEGGTTLVPASPYFDCTVALNTAYLYDVRAIPPFGEPSAPSNLDLATTVLFTDDPLVAGATPIKAVHLTELRTAINAVRTLANLGPYPFTSVTPSNQLIKAVHLSELRTALSAARSHLPLPPATFTNAITAQTSAIKAIDWTEIRKGVQ